MLKATRAEFAGIIDGDPVLRFLGNDEKKYELSLTNTAASEMLIALLQAATALPPNNQIEIEGVEVQGSLQLALNQDMTPALILGIGGLEIALPQSIQSLTTLNDDMSGFLNSRDKPN